MPLSVGIGLATSAFAPPCPGWSSAYEALQQNRPMDAAAAFLRSWTGIYGIDGKEPFGVNLAQVLNPFDMSEAPAWKATLWSGVVMKAVKAIGHVDPIQKVPLVKRYLKFS